MANSNTSLNGYEFGRSPKTTAPFWGGGSEGASIDDTGIYTDKTWSSKKISDELAEKAEADDVYTKSEVDTLLENIPTVDAYTKTETDALLAGKANVTDVYTKSQTYTKTEVDNLISGIPSVDAYTKTETDNLLANKANVSDVYTKTETDTLLAGKAGVNSVYTKGQTDRLLTDKANAADVYTKTQTDNLLADKADVTDLADYAKVTAVYTKSQTYTKTEVDNLISGAGGGAEIDDTAVVSNKTWSSQKIDSEIYSATNGKANSADVYTKSQTDGLLADYAKSTAVYTKAQTYTKTEVDNLISGTGGGSVSYAKTKFSPYNIQGIQYMEGRSEVFTHNNYLWYMKYNNGSRFPVTVTYNDNTSETFFINGDYFNVPWNETPSGSNYPSETAPYKPFVFGNLVIKMCLTNNVLVDNKYFADVVLMAECDKGVASITVNIEHTPMVVSMGGYENTHLTPEDLYVYNRGVLYGYEVEENYYSKYVIDDKINLRTVEMYAFDFESSYVNVLTSAAVFANQFEFAFKLKSGVSFTANSMIYVGQFDVTSFSIRLSPVCRKVNGFVYDDSTYFNIDDASCILLKPNSGSNYARMYVGFKSNYTTTGNEIIRFSFMGETTVDD